MFSCHRRLFTSYLFIEAYRDSSFCHRFQSTNLPSTKFHIFFYWVKLNQQDMPHSLLLFFFSWLKNQTAQISFGNLFTAKFNLEWRLLQGPALSPNLYILFISDLILLFNQYDVLSKQFINFTDLKFASRICHFLWGI